MSSPLPSWTLSTQHRESQLPPLSNQLLTLAAAQVRHLMAEEVMFVFSLFKKNAQFNFVYVITGECLKVVYVRVLKGVSGQHR